MIFRLLPLVAAPALALAHPGHASLDPAHLAAGGHGWEYAGLAAVLLGGIGLWAGGMIRRRR